MKNEKSKSTLALMEQAVMILVFAVAATLCVQAFVRADAYSKELERRDDEKERRRVLCLAGKLAGGGL